MPQYSYPQDFEGTFWTVVDGDYYVSTVGNDISGDGSPKKPFLTVARAFDDALDGEKIIIGPDEYVSYKPSDVTPSGAHLPCRVATTGNFVVGSGGGGEALIDGVQTNTGDRVLVWQQTDPIENGIYLVNTGVWERADDFNSLSEVIGGKLIPVLEGTQNGKKAFQHITVGGIIIDATPIIIEKATATDWGEIDGTLTDQTDLNDALNLKANQSALDSHTADTANPHGVTKAQVGLSNADNTSDADKPVSTSQQAALDLKADNTALTSHESNSSNPHNVTKSQVGLGSADNTADVNKPVSTLQQAALDLKADNSALANHTSNSSNPHNVTKSQVGLGSADNTADIDKPVSTAQQAALDLKADITYVDNLTATIDKATPKGTIDASTNPTYPAGDLGDYYYVTIAGTIGGDEVQIGDKVQCIADTTAGQNANWIIFQGNLDKATTVDAQTGTDDEKYLTPLKAYDGWYSWLNNKVVSELSTVDKTIVGAINEASLSGANSVGGTGNINISDGSGGFTASALDIVDIAGVPTIINTTNALLKLDVDLLPDNTNAYDFGTSVLQFRDIWLSRKISNSVGSLKINGTTGLSLQFNNADVLSILSGEISANSSVISNVTDPTNPQDVATKAYVDTNIIAGSVIVESGSNIYNANTSYSGGSSNNTVYGAFALNAMGAVQIGENTAIGALALNVLANSHSYTTAVGSRALWKAYNVFQNVGIGWQAGGGNVDGDNSIFIGSGAGYTTGIATNPSTLTQTQCTYVGVNASTSLNIGNGSVGSVTNEIVIGYNADGNGSNTATWGNNVIVDHYFFGKINLNSERVTGLADPVNAQDAATKAYVDLQVGGADTNNYLTTAAFATGTGVLTLTRSGLADVTVNLDGRYLTANQGITLGGQLSGSGTTSITAALTAAAITAQTALTSGLVSTDELLVSDAGVLKRMDISVLQSYMQANLNFTVDSNNYVTAASFATGSGLLTLTRSGLANVTVNLDGRYLTANQSITLGGQLSGSGTTSITASLTAAAITGQTALTSGLASTDELLVSDAGVLKRMDVSVLQSYLQSNLSFAATSHNHSAGNITSGTFANARISAGNVTQHQGALSIGWGQITGVPSYLLTTGGTISGLLTANGDILLGTSSHLTRSNHHTGHLEGSYNNVGVNNDKTNPIYTIGSNYNPADALLNNMYGIGFTHTNASFINTNAGSGWGMYVASDGDARIFLNGSNGNAWFAGSLYIGGTLNGNATSASKWATARTITLAGDVTGSTSMDGSGNVTITTAYADDGTFLRANADDIKTSGYLRMNDNLELQFGSGADFRIDFNGTDTVFRNYAHAGGDIIFQGEDSGGSNENLMILDTSGSSGYVRLFQANAERLRTISSGIQVYGTGTATDWIATSDERLKENIRPFGKVLDKIMGLRGSLSLFDWKEGGKDDVGYTAQRLKSQFPDFVQGNETLGVSYGKLSSVALEGVAEVNEEVMSLREEVKELKEQLSKLLK